MNLLVSSLSILCVVIICPLNAETPQSISIDSGGVTINGTKVSSLSNGSNPRLTITLDQLSPILGRPSRVERGGKSGTEIDLWDALGVFLCPGADIDQFGVSLSNELAVTRSPQGVFRGTLSIEKIPISPDVSVSLINTQLDELTFRQVEMFSWGTSWELKYPTYIVELICNKQGKITAVHLSAKSKKDLANPPSQTEANTATNLPPVPETGKLPEGDDQNTLHPSKESQAASENTSEPIATLRGSPAEQCAVAERDLNKAWSELTSQQKSALRQDERGWIKMKDRIPVNDPGRLKIIQRRREYLESLLKAPPQKDQGYPSPNGQFVVTRTGRILNGTSQSIVLKTTTGQELLMLAAWGDFGFTCSWSPDSKHLVVVIPNRIAASVIFVQAIGEEWRTATYEGIPGGPDEKILGWPSANIVQMQAGKKTFTFTFAEYETFAFRLSRFGGITLDTAPGKEKVKIYQGDKGSEGETVFESALISDRARSYVTPQGTRFMLERLIKPVVSDANRKINSGEWKLVISGTDQEYGLIKQKMGSPTFGDTGRNECYGNSLLIGICNQ